MQQVNIYNLIPNDWKSSEVQLFIYKMFVDNFQDLPKSLFKIENSDFICLFCEGKMDKAPYIEIRGFEKNNIVADLKHKDIPLDTYLYIFTKGTNKNSIAQNRCEYVVGTLISTFGKNVAYLKVFESELKFHEDGQTSLSVAGNAIENPNYFGNVTISNELIKSTSALFNKIENFDERTRNRIQTSIRWFEAATRIGGCDAILKLWIAIETLIMPDTTNIRPIKVAMGEIFKLTEAEANIKFKIGRLASLRAEIVHNGFNEPIHSNFLKYLKSIFIDLLHHYLQIEFTPRTDTTLIAYEKDIESILL